MPARPPRAGRPLNPGTSATVNVTYTTGARGTAGRIRVLATSSAYPALKDSGWVNITVPANPAVAVTPDAAAYSRSPRSPDIQEQFQLQNTGDVPDTYAIQAICNADAFATACTPSATSVTLNPGQSTNVTVTYGSGEPSTSGRLVLLATSGVNPAVRDSAWLDISVYPISGVTL